MIDFVVRKRLSLHHMERFTHHVLPQLGHVVRLQSRDWRVVEVRWDLDRLNRGHDSPIEVIVDAYDGGTRG